MRSNFWWQVRKFDHPEEDMLKCLLPLHTRELGRLSIPESEREADPLEDGGPADTRTEEEILEEYTKFMDEHGVPEKVGSFFLFCFLRFSACRVGAGLRSLWLSFVVYLLDVKSTVLFGPFGPRPPPLPFESLAAAA